MPEENGTALSEPSRHARRSENIGQLAAALAAAQGKIRGAAKDAENPFFKSRYADLSSVWEACRQPLSEAGIAVMQFPRATESGIEVETILAHKSGEWVAETLELPAGKLDAQGLGSAITYARRYALASAVGVAPEDDDGNAAADSVNHKRNPLTETAPKQLSESEEEELRGYVAEIEEQVTDLDTMNAALRQWYKRPKGLLKSTCWKSLQEHAKNQGWSFSQKSNKFVLGKGQDAVA